MAKVLENNDWDDFYKNSSDTKTFLEEQEKSYKELVNDSGLVN